MFRMFSQLPHPKAKVNPTHTTNSTANLEGLCITFLGCNLYTSTELWITEEFYYTSCPLFSFSLTFFSSWLVFLFVIFVFLPLCFSHSLGFISFFVFSSVHILSQTISLDFMTFLCKWKLYLHFLVAFSTHLLSVAFFISYFLQFLKNYMLILYSPAFFLSQIPSHKVTITLQGENDCIHFLV